MSIPTDVLDHARTSEHRSAVLGLRQLRHPLQGVRHAGHPAHHRGKARRRRPGQRTDRAGPLGGPAHSVGQGRRLRGAGGLRGGPGRQARARSTATPSRTTTTSSAASRHSDPAVRRKADRPPSRVPGDHEHDRLAGPEDLAGRRHQLPGPGRHARPARTGWPNPCSEIYDRLGEDQRLVLEYKFFEPAFYHTDVPDWGTSYAHCAGPGREGHGLPGHRPPRARAPTSSSSSRSCCAWASWAPSTSTPASTRMMT